MQKACRFPCANVITLTRQTDSRPRPTEQCQTQSAAWTEWHYRIPLTSCSNGVVSRLMLSLIQSRWSVRVHQWHSLRKPTRVLELLPTTPLWRYLQHHFEQHGVRQRMCFISDACILVPVWRVIEQSNHLLYVHNSQHWRLHSVIPSSKIIQMSGRRESSALQPLVSYRPRSPPYIETLKVECNQLTSCISSVQKLTGLMNYPTDWCEQSKI